MGDEETGWFVGCVGEREEVVEDGVEEDVVSKFSGEGEESARAPTVGI